MHSHYGHSNVSHFVMYSFAASFPHLSTIAIIALVRLILTCRIETNEDKTLRVCFSGIKALPRKKRLILFS